MYPFFAPLLVLPILAQAKVADIASDLELQASKGEVVITVSEKIGPLNQSDGTAAFDLVMLLGIPPCSFETNPIWTEGVHEYTAYHSSNYLTPIDASGSIVIAHANNNHSSITPVDHLSEEAPIIAYLKDTAAIHRKDPL